MHVSCVHAPLLRRADVVQVNSEVVTGFNVKPWMPQSQKWVFSVTVAPECNMTKNHWVLRPTMCLYLCSFLKSWSEIQENSTLSCDMKEWMKYKRKREGAPPAAHSATSENNLRKMILYYDIYTEHFVGWFLNMWFKYMIQTWIYLFCFIFWRYLRNDVVVFVPPAQQRALQVQFPVSGVSP